MAGTTCIKKKKERTESRSRRLQRLESFVADAPRKLSPGEDSTICGDIRQAAHEESQRQPGQPPKPDLEALLGVISYCYTKGILSSSEIERELWQSPAFLKVFGDHLPTAHQIRHFRRRNIALILHIIEHALEEFRRRRPDDVRSHVAAAEELPGASAHAIALWLIEMARYRDDLEAD